MSRKQEIYREMLRWALPVVRNRLHNLGPVRRLRLVWRREQQELRCCYEVAELCHNLPLSVLEEEFTEYDLWWLNNHARTYFQMGSNKNCTLHATMARLVQELFHVVPEEMRHHLEWAGPQDDHASPGT